MTQPVESESKLAELPELFGTDGIRERFGSGWLTAASVRRIARATATILQRRDGLERDLSPAADKVVLVGRDTRRSGGELFDLFAGELLRYGVTVYDLGILPTPGIAYVAAQWSEADLGVVLSASHNPAEYNGIKFFSSFGSKVSDAFEAALTLAYAEDTEPATVAPGQIHSERCEAARREYSEYLLSRCPADARWSNRKVVLDTANGATFQVAPWIFRQLGFDVETVGADPDGDNINRDCGALHPEVVADRVRQSGAELGFCFDGDGDRMVPVGGNGSVFNGDHVLYIAAKARLAAGMLPTLSVVGTSMSNFGLEAALTDLGVELLRTDVGDRWVYSAMVEGGHPIGGEQSGHTIFLDDSRTGDGILSALRLLSALPDGSDLEAAAAEVPYFPQRILNVRVREKRPFEELPSVLDAVREANVELSGRGRIVLRYSGTEPLARVMVESEDEAMTERIAAAVAAPIEAALGG